MIRFQLKKYKGLLTQTERYVIESGSVNGGKMKSIEADLLERLEGWNEESIRLLAVLLERIAELPDAEATALTERILAQIDGKMH